MAYGRILRMPGAAVAGVLVGSATVLLAVQRRTTPTVGAPAAVAARGLPAARRIRALVLTLGLVNVLLGLLFGTTQLAVTALARADDAVALAGVYYLTMSVGSLIASAAYGLITWRTPAWRRLAGAGALIAAGGLAMTLLDHPAAVVAALFVVGLGVGPVIILTGTLIERHVGTGLLTQSFALMGALSAAGIALSGLVGGATVEAHGHAGGFLLIVGYGIALCLVGLAVRGLVNRPPPDTMRGEGHWPCLVPRFWHPVRMRIAGTASGPPPRRAAARSASP